MNKKSIIVGTAVVGAIAVGGIIWNSQFQKKKADSITRVSALEEQLPKVKEELLDLYEKRYALLVSWTKLANTKLDPSVQNPYTNELKTEQDVISFEQYQMNVTNQLSKLLTTSEPVKKKIKDLEKIEEQINRKRNEYHEYAFEADDLILKYKTGQNPAPVFPAEKTLHQR